ncbi:hypothetical protein MNB_SV-10-875 [hydrothermal vent metagenome]|uniref:DUF3149 domain-containing protein n=1 Tax=hydrothermal vent metagenome TaxID=652676 RepID=A0A1W1CM18_9ZZZZ
MFDLSQPVPMEVIVGSIFFIFAMVGVGLGVVAYYKKKQTKSDSEPKAKL